MDKQVKLLDIVIVISIIVTASVVVHHHGNLSVRANLTNKCKHVITPLIEDRLLIGRTVNALVAQ